MSSVEKGVDQLLQQEPHRRLNPLTQEWILVSPHRTKRPWQGQLEKVPLPNIPSYEPSCFLCPGNKRASGENTPQYKSTFSFSNDYASLLPDSQVTDKLSTEEDDLFVAQRACGFCKVICFSPRHDLTLPVMKKNEIRIVIDAWVQETADLGGQESIIYVQIFENKGVAMGCSNPHPHCQVWASDFIPQEIAKEQKSFLSYREKKLLSMKTKDSDSSPANGVDDDVVADPSCCCLLCQVLTKEIKTQQQEESHRIVCSNGSFVVIIPFWAAWPFETLLLSRRHFPSFLELSEVEKSDLADIISQITILYDNLFKVQFPYSMGFHQSPRDGQDHPEWHFHAHYYPPLLRSATVRKFMVGYELLANQGRDLTPESSARKLRELSTVHFSQQQE